MHIVQMNSCISSIGIHAFWPNKFMHIVQMNSCILARWSHAFRPDEFMHFGQMNPCISARKMYAFRPDKFMQIHPVNPCILARLLYWIHAFRPDELIEFRHFGQTNFCISARLVPQWHDGLVYTGLVERVDSRLISEITECGLELAGLREKEE